MRAPEAEQARTLLTSRAILARGCGVAGSLSSTAELRAHFQRTNGGAAHSLLNCFARCPPPR